ncbi:hypothetical protein HF521_018172 [Silurus meridionalis]|uniref:Immunoglobulin V-set domain-containing protein n=1 Tax=Silurus meridionalis TaxID=175797 RepID=A0A8T0BIU2_SILME|nr:hypothetical protein HF521_018172 [Silurus meridionalis]
MIISNIIQSDEAVYYCSIISPYSVFGNGTYLKIKGTSKPGLCDDSVKCEATLHGNTNFTTQEKAVNASIEDSPEMMQEAEDEMLNYAALKFSKRKAKAENSSTVSPDECKKDTISSGTSKPGLCDDSVHGDCTKNTTQEKAVLGLGSALGLCVLMIFCLIYFLLRRRKCDQMNASIEDSPGMRQVRVQK